MSDRFSCTRYSYYTSVIRDFEVELSAELMSASLVLAVQLEFFSLARRCETPLPVQCLYST